MITLILFILYTLFRGSKDAILYSGKVKELGFDEHVIWWGESFIVWCIALFAFWNQGFTEIFLIGSGLALIFPFFQNGMYYVVRHKLGVKRYHWFYKSNQSSAKMNFGAPARIFMFILGFILICIGLFY